MRRHENLDNCVPATFSLDDFHFLPFGATSTSWTLDCMGRFLFQEDGAHVRLCRALHLMVSRNKPKQSEKTISYSSGIDNGFRDFR